MQSPPAGTAPITINASAPPSAPTDPATVTVSSIRSATRSRCANSATGTSPGVRHQIGLVEADRNLGQRMRGFPLADDPLDPGP